MSGLILGTAMMIVFALIIIIVIFSIALDVYESVGEFQESCNEINSSGYFNGELMNCSKIEYTTNGGL